MGAGWIEGLGMGPQRAAEPTGVVWARCAERFAMKSLIILWRKSAVVINNDWYELFEMFKLAQTTDKFYEGYEGSTKRFY